MKYLAQIWNDIQEGQNLDIYITIAVSVVIVALGMFGVASENILFSAVLAVLALVSISLLQNRRDSYDIRTQLNTIKSEPQRIGDFLKQEVMWLDQQELFTAAHKVFFWGLSLERTIPLMRDKI